MALFLGAALLPVVVDMPPSREGDDPTVASRVCPPMWSGSAKEGANWTPNQSLIVAQGCGLRMPNRLWRTASRVYIQSQRVDPTHKICAEGRVDRAVAGDAGLAVESGRADADVEMAFAALLIAGMPLVAFAVVDDLQLVRDKSLGQALGDFVGNGHWCHFPGNRFEVTGEIFLFRPLQSFVG